MHSFLRFLQINCFLLCITPSLFVQAQGNPLSSFEKQLEQSLDEKDDGKAAFYCYEIAKVYTERYQKDKTLEYLSKSANYAGKAKDNVLTHLAYQLMGETYFELKNYSKAVNSFQKALKAARSMGKTEYVRECLIDLGLCYVRMEKGKRAVKPFEEALSLAIRDKNVAQQRQCYQLLANVYESLGNSGKSKEYLTLLDNMVAQDQAIENSAQQLQALEEKVGEADEATKIASDRLTVQSKKLRRTEESLLITKYSLDTVEQSLEATKTIAENQQLQIDLLSKDKEIAEIQVKEQQTRLENEALVRNFIMVAAVLALALIIVLVYGYRKKLEANKQIALQNENIQSSINYAKRIQEAMLHRSDLGEHQLPNSFVLFKPRDVVSGDFYWVTEIKSWYDPDVVIAAADCTGHGIPGAFMSMIGMNALNGIITQGIAESNQILDALDKEIREALQQETTGNKDGMDVALLIYRKEKNIIEFSGAKNPLIYIQDGELHRIKGDVHAIGGSRRHKNGFHFKKHVVTIDQPTTIYLFSDGFQDQFGGTENTKFMSKRFKKLLLEIHHKPMPEQMEILDNTIKAWMGSQKQTDDILVMGIQLDELD